jgi:hypothetical protein
VEDCSNRPSIPQSAGRHVPPQPAPVACDLPHAPYLTCTHARSWVEMGLGSGRLGPLPTAQNPRRWGCGARSGRGAAHSRRRCRGSVGRGRYRHHRYRRWHWSSVALEGWRMASTTCDSSGLGIWRAGGLVSCTPPRAPAADSPVCLFAVWPVWTCIDTLCPRDHPAPAWRLWRLWSTAAPGAGYGHERTGALPSSVAAATAPLPLMPNPTLHPSGPSHATMSHTQCN